MIKGVQTRVDSQIHPVALIENPEAIQAAIMHMIDAVLKGTIDTKRANVIIKALHIAVRNSRNVRFQLRPDDMVREVPNYAEQYLTEHPELNPLETHLAPDVPVQGAEPGPPELKKKSQPDRARRFPQNCHPEPARLSRESKDPHSAICDNNTSGNSPNPPERDREKTSGEELPLTNHQIDQNQELKKLEACIEGAMHGNWRDLRTVFNAVGLTPHKPDAQ
jgi:hypothetical protein